MIIDEAIGLSAVIINETVGDKINKANAVINYLNDLNALCLLLKRYTKNIIKKVTDQGILVVLASGRISESVLTIAKEIGANKYYISGNGSVLYLSLIHI